MINVADTHSIIWFLERNPKLSATAATALRSRSDTLVVPTIVLAEITHLFRRRRISISPDHVRLQLTSAYNCRIYPLDEHVASLLPPELDIHDAILVATAILFRNAGEPTRVITRDSRIHSSGIIDTCW